MAARPKPLEHLLGSAEDQLWTDFEKTRVFDHAGVMGSGREGAVARFLRQHLPARFVVTSGQAVDALGTITTQLDLVVYDSYLSAPLLRSEEGAELMPAEALLAVVEVKSIFKLKEARTCAKAVASIGELKPYGKAFIPARTAGADASDAAPRCMYSIFAFDSDLSAVDWPQKEWDRLREAARESDVDVARTDRLTVLTRGLVVPPTCTALPATDGKGMLRDWYLHLSDFLVREAARRNPYDWDRYGRRPTSSGWQRLDGYKSVNEAKRQKAASRHKATRSSRPAKSDGKGRPRKRSSS